MKYLLSLALLFSLNACIEKKVETVLPMTAPPAGGVERLHYTVNLNDIADDLFKVSLAVDDLGPENDIYQFASTAPGTYQLMDIGRFVRRFAAFDAAGGEISTEQVSTNQWRLSKPEAVARIDYAIAETWDTEVEEHPVYPMAGTSLEKAHAQLLAHAVFGYPTGMQDRPLLIELKRPEHWLVGTALSADEAGRLLADSYDHAVDSPILLGELTHASMDFRGGVVEVYSYCGTPEVTATRILEETRDVVESVGEFLKGFPVERYTFLYLLEDKDAGAWEHSYSSNYVFSERNFEMVLPTLDSVVAHEIFHIVTPLNIHSELIESFDFVTPQPSQHLWLYEATTEWAAHIMRLRSGNIDLDMYFSELLQKLHVSGMMREDVSLTEIAMNSFNPGGARDYPNVYMRGALTIGLLDIRLLELSEGKRGLREVLLELAAAYGKEKAFSEEHFFEEFTRRTYPEIADFFNRYVKDHQPLPMAEYYAKLGIIFEREASDGTKTPWLGFDMTPINAETLAADKVGEAARTAGLLDGDILLGLNDIPFKQESMAELGGVIRALKPGDGFTLDIKRDKETMKVALQMQERIREGKNRFVIDEEAGEAQVALREAWSKNL